MESIVIIGAGQAAIWAVHTLRQQGYQGDIHVVSDEEHCFYERPPLSKQVLLGEMTHEQLQFFPLETIESFNIQLHKPCRAEKIDIHNKLVHLENGQKLPYHKVLIATGSKARFPIPEWEHMENVFSLRSIADSELLKNALPNIREMVVLGGGWIGLEIAASLQKQNIKVTLLELGERLCARSVSHEVSEFLHDLHVAEGVDLQLSCGNVALETAANGQVKIYQNGVLSGQVDAVLVGAGAHINKELAVDIGLKTADGIIVDEYCQTSIPDVFAAGDVAIHPSLGFSIQSWANAQNQGIAAAKNMLGMNEAYADIPWLWSDQFDCNIQILGTPSAANELTAIVRKTSDRQISYFYLDADNQLRYVVAVNDSKVIKLAKRWMSANMQLDPKNLEDIHFNLMTLKAKK